MTGIASSVRDELPAHGLHRVIAPAALHYGSALVLVTTSRPDGSDVMLRPFSACTAVGRTLMLGLDGRNGPSRTLENLRATGSCVVNVPQAELHATIGAFAAAARDGAAGDGFGVMRLTPIASETVTPPRVRECYLQAEARVTAIHASSGADPDTCWAELAVTRVHAVADIVVPGSDHVDPDLWQPLVYSFRRILTTSPAVTGP